MSTQPKTLPKTIEILADAVHPSFAMLAGMELDVFTPLKGGRYCGSNRTSGGNRPS